MNAGGLQVWTNGVSVAFSGVVIAAAAALAGCQTAEPPAPGPPEGGICANMVQCPAGDIPSGCSIAAPVCANGIVTCGPVVCPDASGDDQGGPDASARPDGAPWTDGGALGLDGAP